MKTVTNI